MGGLKGWEGRNGTNLGMDGETGVEERRYLPSSGTSITELYIRGTQTIPAPLPERPKRFGPRTGAGSPRRLDRRANWCPGVRDSYMRCRRSGTGGANRPDGS